MSEPTLERLVKLAYAFNEAASQKISDAVYDAVKNTPKAEEIRKKIHANMTDATVIPNDPEKVFRTLLTVHFEMGAFQDVGGICNSISIKKLREAQKKAFSNSSDKILAEAERVTISQATYAAYTKDIALIANRYVDILSDAFDEATIKSLIPAEAKNPEVAKAFKKLGAKKLAKLCA